MNTQTNKKQQSKAPSSDTLIEQLRDMGRGISKNVTQDLVGGVATDALSSLFGTPKKGTLRPGEPVNLRSPQPADDEAAPQSFPEFFNPFKRREQAPKVTVNNEALNLLRQKEAEVTQKIEEIRLELKALIATLKTVDKQVEKAIDEQLVDPGLYHINFLDRLKTILKLMRQSLSESSSWLSVMRSRKKEKRYWTQYKKKGTTFGLSNERVVSTQVG